MFEAPTKDLQVELIRAVGPAVNLGNVATSDVIGVEALRRGLRGDTLLDLTTGVSASRIGAGPLTPERITRPAAA
jgi:phosphosulfolactate synthase